MKILSTQKIFTVIFIALFLFGVLMSGCAKQEPAAAPTATPNDAGKSAEPIKLRFITDYNQKDLKGQLVKSFVDKVVEKSNGQVEIDFFSDGQLFKSNQYPDALSKGSVDMAFAVFGSGWPNTIPELTILSCAPFANTDEAKKALNGPLGDKLKALLEEKTNTKVLAWAGVGSADASASKERIFKNLEDMKGLRIRVVTPTQVEYVKKFGAAGAIITPSELYLALQRGTVDGLFCTSVTSALSNKLYEVVKKWTRASFVGTPMEMGFVINIDSWNKLPAEVQKIMEETAQEVSNELITQTAAAVDKDWEKMAQQPGVEVYTMPKEDLAKWQELMLPARMESLQKAVPEEVAKELMELATQAK